MLVSPLGNISIHAPRVGSDNDAAITIFAESISIHAPRVGSDGNEVRANLEQFYFNPRSPCGERHHVILQ